MRKLLRSVSVLSVLFGLGTLSRTAGGVYGGLDYPIFSLNGAVGFTAGSVKYRIGEIEIADVGLLGSTRETLAWRSELEFPKDIMRGDIVMAIRGEAAPRWDWAMSVDVWMNLTDPDDKMTDTDYLDYVRSEGFYQWQQWRYITAQNHLRLYSESDAKLDMAGFDAKLKFVRRTEAGPIGWVLGYRYQEVSYDLYGLEGYAEGTTVSGVMESIPRTEKVLEYDVLTRMPYVGLVYEFSLFNRLKGSLEGDYAPWVWVDDHDHHIRRAFRNESETDGTGFMLNLTARYDIAPRVFAELKLDYVRVVTDGDTTRIFYTATEEWPGGMAYNGPIKITDQEAKASFGVGIEF